MSPTPSGIIRYMRVHASAWRPTFTEDRTTLRAWIEKVGAAPWNCDRAGAERKEEWAFSGFIFEPSLSGNVASRIRLAWIIANFTEVPGPAFPAGVRIRWRIISYTLTHKSSPQLRVLPIFPWRILKRNPVRCLSGNGKPHQLRMLIEFEVKGC